MINDLKLKNKIGFIGISFFVILYTTNKLFYFLPSATNKHLLALIGWIIVLYLINLRKIRNFEKTQKEN
jgi:MFS superfamily sulfate permease-like transporter